MKITLEQLEYLNGFGNLVSCIAAVALVIVALYGLKQLKISKEEMEATVKDRIINAKRNSIQIAAEKCEQYLENIENTNKTDQMIIDKKLDFFTKSKTIIKKDSIEVISENADFHKCMSDDEFLTQFLKTVNYHEAFALFFTARIANDNVGFQTVGKTYCYTMKKYLPLIVKLANSEYYRSAVSLYIHWNNRIEIINLQSKKKNIDERLASIDVKDFGTFGVD